MQPLKRYKWLSSREEKRRNLREAGLDAPPRRATSFNTSERHMRAAFFGDACIPGFACKAAAVVAVALMSVCGYPFEVEYTGGDPLATAYPDSYRQITSVVVPESATNLVDGAFKGCIGVTSVVFSAASTIATIAEGAFEGCVSLQKVELPASIEEIGARAFYGCTGLSDRLVIPENVNEIGAYAFAYCSNLVRVCYYGDRPETVATNIYVGTRTSLVSNVLSVRAGWTTSSDSDDADADSDDGGETPTTNNVAAASTSVPRLPGRWPVNHPPGRPIHWWTSVKLAKISFSYQGGSGELEPQYYVQDGGRTIEGLEEPDERDGYSFDGWFTAPHGGVEVTDGYEVSGSMTLYAHWSKDSDSDDSDDSSYDFSRASVFHGYLVEDDSVSGVAEIKIAKGRWNKNEEETNAVVRATITLLGGGRVTGRGTLHEDGSGEVEFPKSESTFDFSCEGGVITGSFDGADLTAYIDNFSSTDYNRKNAALAAVDDFMGNYVLSLNTTADGDSTYAGYTGLSISVGSRGRSTVKGTLPDGTRVSAQSTLLVAVEDGAYTDVQLPFAVPLYSGRKGGFGFLLRFAYNDGETSVAVESVSPWTGASGARIGVFEDAVAGLASALSSGVHAVEVDIGELAAEGEDLDDALTPDGTEFTVDGSRWVFPAADKVKFVRDDESYETTVENGNPAGIKLSYTAKTGSFKGSFKVYSVTESGRSKKRIASVAGVVVDGVGYGTALIKKVGAVPIVLE